MTYSELLVGCGSNWQKKLVQPGTPPDWQNLTTVDINPDHNPTLIHDLESLPLPLADNSFDEIHAYEVLEHIGSQGDYKFFFAQFEDFWRMLKPDGLLIGTVPMWNSVWAWGDPSHKRVIQKESFIFLDQEQYKIQVGKTAMSDFRYIYSGDFTALWYQEAAINFSFVLKAVKPSRK
jgi:predicted SAM-dependent methyltransferase